MTTGANSNPVQVAIILDHLRSAPITPIEALNKYGCFRLAARIHELREAGYEILTITQYADNGKHYASYYLVGQGDKDGAPV